MSPEPNPLEQIEDKKFWTDTGRQGFYIMQGALEEGATLMQALHVVSSYYAGMIKGILANTEEDEDKEKENDSET